MQDMTTFLASFLAVFGGIAAVLWHLERRAKALEARLATLEAAASTAKPKGSAAEGRPKA